MTRDDLIELTLLPATHDIGGFKVHRTLPHRERTMVGPFLFFDQMGPAHLPPGEGMDVRPHPHINLATVTYLFDGAIGHRDSLGTQTVIRPGAVNLMTAGRGIVHSERSPEEARRDGPALSGIQTWLALPDGQEEIDPAFEHVPAADLPVIEGDGVTARVIMGDLWGKRAPTTTYAGTIYADIALAPGASVPIDAAADERAIYLVEGEAMLEGVALEPQRLYVLRPGIAATLRSTSGARAMLAGGDAFATPRHVWWNFVSSSRERIQEAKRAWMAREFPVVPGDEIEWIPIPGQPKTVSYP
ncbi:MULTISPECIES: pirin family protein [Sphingomonas]|jgi:redox-sensitive bicupin YhaK (pirin superfamily)|uniref:Pirin family protein n=1 Tax=Sphingomonas olei TaxID=1886787 RepID=A0ABY2QE47_9SPHN|nr:MULTISPECIES: pirin family protein [Sphingomonas]KKI18497.1 pirin [Sphingomonas sp. Ag1]THG38508.1 pirin family protein [Sphingomonas olei]